jgi:5-methylcytosine-specific restriction endonuclease McrA
VSIDWDDDLRATTAERGYDSDWERLRGWVVRRHVAKYGWTCPGLLVPAHPSRDLTGHHIVPLSEGGENVASNVAVLCRGCNVREQVRRRHPLPKRCPEGHPCPRPPDGNFACCGHHGRPLGE